MPTSDFHKHMHIQNKTNVGFSVLLSLKGPVIHSCKNRVRILMPWSILKWTILSPYFLIYSVILRGKKGFFVAFVVQAMLRVTADEPQDTGALPPEASASRADVIQP